MIILVVVAGLLLAGALLHLIRRPPDAVTTSPLPRYGDDRDWARNRDELRAAGQRARA